MRSLPWNGPEVKLALMTVLVAFLASCSKPASDQTNVVFEATPKVAAPDPKKIAEAGELAKRFGGESDQATRIELIYQLALNGSPPALQTLGELYRRLSDDELKDHIVRAQSFVTARDLTPVLAFLGEALQPSQPPELRATAAETLREIEKPETLPLWQTLTGDTDPGIQDTARAAIEFLSAQFPGK